MVVYWIKHKGEFSPFLLIFFQDLCVDCAKGRRGGVCGGDWDRIVRCDVCKATRSLRCLPWSEKV